MFQQSASHTVSPTPIDDCSPGTSASQQSCCGLLLQGDLTDKKTVDQVAERAKTVDILVNNAGMLDKESILEGEQQSRCCPGEAKEL